MKIAIISDIHGNYHALVKVIDDAVMNKVDSFIFAGDYIFDLPFSNEVTHLIMEMKNAYVVKGNKESYLRGLANENQENWIFDQMQVIYQIYKELSGEALDFLTNLEEERFIPLGSGGLIYVTHTLKAIAQKTKMNCASVNFHRKMLNAPFTHQQFLLEFNEILKQAEWRRAIGEISASVIVFGHDHLQCHGYCDGKLIINPGSCGQPLDFNNNASYTILEETVNGLNVIERRIEYDVESVINEAKKSRAYAKGKVWSELVFLALRTARDYFGLFFETAQKVADSKGEKGRFFSNETWEDAYNAFMKR